MEQRLLTAEEVRKEMTETSYSWQTEEEVERLFAPKGVVDGDEALAAMLALPLVWLEAQEWNGMLIFETARPLTPPEAWRLAMLGPDTPETIEPGQTRFTLWWD